MESIVPRSRPGHVKDIRRDALNGGGAPRRIGVGSAVAFVGIVLLAGDSPPRPTESRDPKDNKIESPSLPPTSGERLGQ